MPLPFAPNRWSAEHEAAGCSHFRLPFVAYSNRLGLASSDGWHRSKAPEADWVRLVIFISSFYRATTAGALSLPVPPIRSVTSHSPLYRRNRSHRGMYVCAQADQTLRPEQHYWSLAKKGGNISDNLKLKERGTRDRSVIMVKDGNCLCPSRVSNY